jgi:nucleotide-binding universal stress UspA family protein
MRSALLVPLDGSPFAEQALPFAISLARVRHARLHLVRVRSALPVYVDHAEAERYLAQISGVLEPQLPGRIETHLLTDEHGPLDYPPPASTAVAELIAAYTAQHDIHTVVMATHGHGGVRRAWLGSVADALIRLAPRPIFLVRPRDVTFSVAALADRGLHHILIPLDGSEFAEQAIAFALELGSPYSAHYTLLRVISPLSWAIVPQYYEPQATQRSPLSRSAVADSLERLAQRLRDQGVDVQTRIIDAISPGPAIVDSAAELGVDAIVIGTHGAGRIRRMLLGSVTDKVVRGSAVPVLVCNVRRMELRTDVAAATAAGAVLPAP